MLAATKGWGRQGMTEDASLIEEVELRRTLLSCKRPQLHRVAVNCAECMAGGCIAQRLVPLDPRGPATSTRGRQHLIHEVVVLAKELSQMWESEKARPLSPRL